MEKVMKGIMIVCIIVSVGIVLWRVVEPSLHSLLGNDFEFVVLCAACVLVGFVGLASLHRD